MRRNDNDDNDIINILYEWLTMLFYFCRRNCLVTMMVWGICSNHVFVYSLILYAKSKYDGIAKLIYFWCYNSHTHNHFIFRRFQFMLFCLMHEFYLMKKPHMKCENFFEFDIGLRWLIFILCYFWRFFFVIINFLGIPTNMVFWRNDTKIGAFNGAISKFDWLIVAWRDPIWLSCSYKMFFIVKHETLK